MQQKYHVARLTNAKWAPTCDGAMILGYPRRVMGRSAALTFQHKLQRCGNTWASPPCCIMGGLVKGVATETTRSWRKFRAKVTPNGQAAAFLASSPDEEAVWAAARKTDLVGSFSFPCGTGLVAWEREQPHCPEKTVSAIFQQETACIIHNDEGWNARVEVAMKKSSEACTTAVVYMVSVGTKWRREKRRGDSTSPSRTERAARDRSRHSRVWEYESNAGIAFLGELGREQGSRVY